MSIQPSMQHDMKQTSLQEAQVIGGGRDNWMIQAEQGVFKARKAVSCLVNPEIGDTVLCANLSSGASSILAILERKQSQTTQLKFDGDVDISASQSIRMIAGQRLDAFSADKMNLDASKLTIRSTLASVIFDKLGVTGNEARHTVSKVEVLAKTLETVSETSRQVMQHSFRLVSALDSVSAGEVLQKIKSRFTVQSRQASVLAEEDARVNGKRVHLG